MNKKLTLILFIAGAVSFSVSAPSWFSRSKPVVVLENPFHLAEKANLAALKKTRTDIRDGREWRKHNVAMSKEAVEYAMKMHDSAPDIHDLQIERGIRARAEAKLTKKEIRKMAFDKKKIMVTADKFDAVKSAGRVWAKK